MTQDLGPTLSVITPAYREAANLPRLYERLCESLGALRIDWEWIVVDDHSPDETFQVAADLARGDPRVRAIRLARNHGSHKAIVCGLDHARGACAVVMASDLQDPPEAIAELFARWRSGAHVVWAVRAGREGERAATRGFSRFYYFLMRRFVGMKEMPSTGADFFLIDRRVIEALKAFGESHVNLFALITWMGFKQDAVSYQKQARAHGASSWTLEKKLKLVLDSITSFTYLPIRLMSYAGFAFACLGFLYALWVVYHGLTGHPQAGWASLMVVVLVVGGIQMLMMGILGEYLWRALDESRRRPKYLIEAVSGEVTEPAPAPVRASEPEELRAKS